MLSLLGIDTTDVGIAISSLCADAASLVAVMQALDCSTEIAIFMVLQGFMMFIIVSIIVGLSYITFLAPPPIALAHGIPFLMHRAQTSRKGTYPSNR